MRMITASHEKCDNAQGVAKVSLQLSLQNPTCILVLLLINKCILFHMNNCKATLAPPTLYMK